MKFKLTMESAIVDLKFALSLFACWPLPADAKPSHVWWYNCWWWVLFIQLTVGSTTMINSLYLNIHDRYMFIKLATEYSLLLSDIIKMLIFKVDAPRLQVLLAELQDFVNQATKEEMELIQNYVNKCLFYYVVLIIFTIVGDFVIILATSISPQPLIGNAVYPFSLEPFWVWAIVYSSQLLVLLQTDVMAAMNLVYTFLLWLTAARFEIMCVEFQRSNHPNHIKRCVKKHQKLIEYTDTLSRSTRIMALHVMTFAIFGVTTGGFMLVYAVMLALIVVTHSQIPPWYGILEYIVYYTAISSQFYMFTWPSDDLMDMSEKILRSVYNSTWFDKPEMLQDTLIIAQRSQFPMIITIKGVMPALSLELFGSAVTASFSYLAMLRAVAGDKEAGM